MLLCIQTEDLSVLAIIYIYLKKDNFFLNYRKEDA